MKPVGLMISVFAVLATQGAAQIPHHVQLVQDLMKRSTEELGAASRFTRPIRSGKTLDVKVAIKLRQMMRMDTLDQLLTSTVWLYMDWTNEYMTWDPDNYGNITSVEWRAQSDIWLPDVTFYDAVEAELALSDHSHGIIIKSNGATSYVLPHILRTPCRGDVTKFPFDQHSCDLTIGPWLYPVDEENMTVHSERDFQFFEFFKGNQMWECLLEDIITDDFQDLSYSEMTFRTIRYKLILTRNASFFFFSLILPGCLLNILTFVVFFLPPDFADSVSIGVSIFLSYVVLVIVLVEETPSGGQSLPLMGQFYCVNMCMAVVCIICSTVTFNVQRQSVPPSIDSTKKLRIAARLLFIPHKEEKETTADFWMLFALVLNRVFFLAYLTVTVAASSLIFLSLTP